MKKNKTLNQYSNQSNNNQNNKTKQSKILKKVFISLVCIVVLLPILALAGFWGYIYLGGEKPDLSLLSSQSSHIAVYDDNSQLISSKQNDEFAVIDEIPSMLSNAFVAVEDKRFYKHNGIDIIRIGGAILNNIKGNRTQGASTITQQLAKNVYLSSEQTLTRKIKEMQYAIKLERQLSKDEIMQSYLNILYFGSGEYGVKNAAMRFFAKELQELNALECAMLAGIVKSPTKYNPINNYDNSIQRARLVLELMLEQGFIDESIYNSYIDSDITIKNHLIENTLEDNYLNNAIYEACSILNSDKNTIAKNGYSIYTFYNKDAQSKLYSTINNSQYYTNETTNGLGIICDNQTRGIKAFSSKYDINLFEFSRQVGSTIKPLASYTPALDQGLISPLQKILDEPTTFDNYSPSNYQDQYYGWTSIQDCVNKSLNIPAVKIMQQVGIDTSIDYLKKMHIDLEDDRQNLAIALGGTTYGIAMIDLLGGYTTLANYGNYLRPTFINYITDNQGNIVYDSTSRIASRVFDEQSSYLMTYMLTNCSKEGTAKKLATLDYQIACKTGTVSMSDKSYNSDIYAVGYTSLDSFLFWQGDDSMPSTNTGGGATTLMAKNYLSNYYNQIKPLDFAIPQGISEVYIDKYLHENANQIVLASENAPMSTKIATYVSQKCMPTLYDNTFDNIVVNNINFDFNDGYLTLNFDCNPKLRYKIYKRSLNSGEYLIEDISNSDGAYTKTIQCNDLFGNKITVVPYYIDDNGIEIIGTPSKFYTTAFSKRFFD